MKNTISKKYNISTKFLLPTLKFSQKFLDEHFENFGFINTFVKCNLINYPYEVLYLLFRPDQLDVDFFMFEKQLLKNSNYIETFDLGRNYVLFVFRIPKEFKRDFNFFLEGKYSKTSRMYQNLFPKETYIVDSSGKKVRDARGFFVKEFSSFYHIFNKTDFLKNKWREKLGYTEDDPIFEEIELYDTQDINKETFNPPIEL